MVQLLHSQMRPDLMAGLVRVPQYRKILTCICRQRRRRLFRFMARRKTLITLQRIICPWATVKTTHLTMQVISIGVIRVILMTCLPEDTKLGSRDQRSCGNSWASISDTTKLVFKSKLCLTSNIPWPRAGLTSISNTAAKQSRNHCSTDL